jgi:hypothetical protein
MFRVACAALLRRGAQATRTPAGGGIAAPAVPAHVPPPTRTAPTSAAAFLSPTTPSIAAPLFAPQRTAVFLPASPQAEQGGGPPHAGGVVTVAAAALVAVASVNTAH